MSFHEGVQGLWGAAQDLLQRRRAVAHRDRLGEENRTHAALTQEAHQPETALNTRSESGVNFHRSHDSDRAILAEM